MAADCREQLTACCAAIDFGPLQVSGPQKAFYGRFNHEIIRLCRSVPTAIQTDALLFFMRYSQSAVGTDVNFFDHCYVPLWSIIYWLARLGSGKLSRQDTDRATTAQAMAIFLHWLDDQVADGDIPASHLVLLLRSLAWEKMNRAFEALAGGSPNHRRTADGCIEDYYAAISAHGIVGNLDAYCRRFERQMALGFVAPLLMAEKVSGGNFAETVRAAYAQFGIAWRLLDDIQDIAQDMAGGVRSAVYVVLPEKMQQVWDRFSESDPDTRNRCTEAVFSYLLEANILDTLSERSAHALLSAASLAHRCGMSGLAAELDGLRKPLAANRRSASFNMRSVNTAQEN